MNNPEWVRRLENQSAGRPVLLVEGVIDVDLLSHFLDQVAPGWNVEISMLPARRKSRVIDAVQKYHPQWTGIVDRDEWSPEQVSEILEGVPRVKALPRFCIESYFCVPDELWFALPPPWKQMLAQEHDHLGEPILGALSDWVAHGAMWRVIRGRRTALLYGSGFPAELDREPVTDLAEIRRILVSWYEQLDPDQIIDEYQQELARAQNLEFEDQLTCYVHGKKFFRQVVVPVLNKLFGQASPDTWLDRFMREPHSLPVPEDLNLFLRDVLASFSSVEIASTGEGEN